MSSSSARRAERYKKNMTSNAEETVKKLLKAISATKPTNNDIVLILSHLLFSIGASLEKCEVSLSKEILLRYATNPTLGNTLMAQAMHMKECWVDDNKIEEKGTTDDGEH